MANKTQDNVKKSASTTNKELKAKIDEQQKQIEALMEMIKNQQSAMAVTAKPVSNDIDMDEEILVISLIPNKLNLPGRDGSVLFSFDHMYEEQYVDYSSLKEIVTANRQMAKNGRFYIMDERVVNKLRLKNDYKNILSPEQLKEILVDNVNSAIELYKMAPKGQKSVIIELVKDKKFNGGGVDYNLLKDLSELCGVDLVNIEDATKIEVK